MPEYLDTVYSLLGMIHRIAQCLFILMISDDHASSSPSEEQLQVCFLLIPETTEKSEPLHAAIHSALLEGKAHQGGIGERRMYRAANLAWFETHQLLSRPLLPRGGSYTPA